MQRVLGEWEGIAGAGFETSEALAEWQFVWAWDWDVQPQVRVWAWA